MWYNCYEARKKKNESHTQYDIEYHLVCTAKYMYKILRGKIAERCREIIRQVCE